MVFGFREKGEKLKENGRPNAITNHVKIDTCAPGGGIHRFWMDFWWVPKSHPFSMRHCGGKKSTKGGRRRQLH